MLMHGHAFFFFFGCSHFLGGGMEELCRAGAAPALRQLLGTCMHAWHGGLQRCTFVCARMRSRTELALSKRKINY